MNMIRKILIVIFLILLALAMLYVSADAQCPMCRMSAESNLKHGGSAGKGLNTGILFLLSTPYLIVGTLGYIYWRSKKKAIDEQA
jgi:hypothetical protein